MNALATPASVRLTFDNGQTENFHIDPVEPAAANRQVFRFDSQTTTSVKITITSVYPPEFSSATTGTSGEVAISEVSFLHTPDGNPIGSGNLVQAPGVAVPTGVPSAISSDIPAETASPSPISSGSVTPSASAPASKK